MSKITNVMIGLLEEQAALLHRHINVLKQLSGADSEAAVTAAPEVPKKKVKAPVDPNKPKRPLSGYQLFMADKNASFKEKNPDSNATVIMTMVANAWSILTPEQKDSYLQRAEKLKETYLEEMQDYEVNKAKDIAEGNYAAPVASPKKVKAPKAAAASSSSGTVTAPAPVAAAAPKKAAAPVVVAAPVAAPAGTPKKDEEKSRKHKRSDSDSSEAVLFTAPETAAPETDKKKKVRNTLISLLIYVGQLINPYSLDYDIIL